MNDNVKKLIEKAGLGQLQHVGGGEWDYIPTPRELKLVELVAKECINIIWKNRIQPLDAGMYKSSDDAIANIKQHFNIK